MVGRHYTLNLLREYSMRAIRRYYIYIYIYLYVIRRVVWAFNCQKLLKGFYLKIYDRRLKPEATTVNTYSPSHTENYLCISYTFFHIYKCRYVCLCVCVCVCVLIITIGEKGLYPRCMSPHDKDFKQKLLYCSSQFFSFCFLFHKKRIL